MSEKTVTPKPALGTGKAYWKKLGSDLVRDRWLYLLLIPAVCLTGLVLHAPFLVIFLCCYIDEPIRFLLMQLHMYSGKWIRPVTDEGLAALPAFRESLKQRKKKAA